MKKSICILNASNPALPYSNFELDDYEDYRGGDSCLISGGLFTKKVTSWHSWAAALKTEFLVYGKKNWQNCFSYDAVIVLVSRECTALKLLIDKLLAMGKVVCVSFHEGVQDLLDGCGMNVDKLDRLKKVRDLCSDKRVRFISFIDTFSSFYSCFLDKQVYTCSHGAPFHLSHLVAANNEQIKKPKNKRPKDILVGTRTLGHRLSRNTLASLYMVSSYAKKNNLNNCYYLSNDQDKIVSSFFKNLGLENIKVIENTNYSFNQWLSFISDFKLIYHFDTSLNFGQICLDAAMVDVAVVGSTTSINVSCDTSDGADSNKSLEILDRSFKSSSNVSVDLLKSCYGYDVISERLNSICE